MSNIARGFGRAVFLAVSFAGFVLFSTQASAQFICPGFGTTWPTGQPVDPWHRKALNLPAAWQLACGTAYVAAIDNGVNVANQQLGPNVRGRFSRWFNVEPTSETNQAIHDISERAIAGTVGHGNHVSGLIAARPSSTNANDAVGACPSCSLMMMAGRIQYDGRTIVEAYESGAQVINMSLGTVIDPNAQLQPGECKRAASGGGIYLTSFCNALDMAAQRDVLIVAAAGNEGNASLNFPASWPGVLAVGGARLGSSLDPNQPEFWAAESVFDVTNNAQILFGSNLGAPIVAPARTVTSTFVGPVSPMWHEFADSALNCTAIANVTNYGQCSGTSMATPLVSGIAGLVRSVNPYLSTAEVKSLLTTLAKHGGGNMGSGVPDANDAVQAALNTGTTGSSVVNRTVPLFAMYSSEARNHFYTVVPQMFVAAATGTMRPRPRWTLRLNGQVVSSLDVPSSLNPPAGFTLTAADGDPVEGGHFLATITYRRSNGTTFPPVTYQQTSGAGGAVAAWNTGSNLPPSGAVGYVAALDVIGESPVFYDPAPAPAVSTGSMIPALPTCGFGPLPPYCGATAIASVFTTHKDPAGGNLVPLYRMSWRCGEGPPSSQLACTQNPSHVSHVYSTNFSEVAQLQAAGFVLDGIEGFIYPPGTQPPGTVPLCRLYGRHVTTDTNSDYLDDYLLFPGWGPGLTCASPSGYEMYSEVYNSDRLGYVLPVQAQGPYYGAGSIDTAIGNSQSTSVGTAFATGLRPRVLDSTGNPVSGAVVTFTTPSSGSSAALSTYTATTDSTGYTAAVTATANCAVGTYNVGVQVGSVPGSFILTNVVGAAASLAFQGGDNQHVAVGSTFSPIVIRVLDGCSNAVPNTTVTFQAFPSGGGASASVPASAVSDSSGNVTITPVANSIAGSYTIVASTSGASNLTISLTNEVPIATTLTLLGATTPQSALINTGYALPLVVYVTDQFGSAMAGVSVTFSPSTSPEGASAFMWPSTTATTDASGIALVSAVANGIPGSFTVTASASGLPPVSWALTNTTEPSVSMVTGGFESPVVSGSGSGPVATGWTGTGAGTYNNSGLTANGGLAAPEGTQAGWYNSSGGTLKQSRKLMAGSYTLTFSAMSKSGGGATAISVRLNGTQAATFNPSSAAWNSYTVTMSHVPTGSNEIAFAANSGTTKIYIDNVVLTRNPSVADFSNGSFETPVVTTSGTPTGWVSGTSVSASYLASVNTPAAPDGNQALLVSNSGLSIKQTLVLEPGAYKVVFKAIMRTAQPNTTLALNVDGVAAGTVTVVPSTWTEFTVPIRIAQRGGYELGFQEGTSRPMFVDNVRLLPDTALGAQVGGFETPVTSSAAPLASPWTTNGGLTHSNSSLASYLVPAAPQGVQAASYATTAGWIKQIVDVLPGGYTLAFKAVGRPGQVNGPLVIKLNGTQVASYSLSTATWTQYSLVLPHLPAGAELQFTSNGTGTSASRLFIDDVTLTRSNAWVAFSNGSFEEPWTGGGLGGAPTGWTNGQVFGGTYAAQQGLPSIPQGLQATRLDLQQPVTLDPGFYHVSVQAAVRTTSATFTLQVDGVDSGNATIVPGSWQTVSFPVVITNSGTYNIGFVSRVAGTVFIDNALINRD